MSEYTDYMEWCFFNHAANVREEAFDTEKWINDYFSKRKDYPKWRTRDGQEIKVEDVTDSHLENLLRFLKDKDETWYQVFTCEKRYRELVKKLPRLKKENKECEKIIDLVF